jgi:hypothetical protein
MDLEAHRAVCTGSACDTLPDANFYWAVFERDSDAAFFFELEMCHEGGRWTAWLVHHGHRPACDDRFPVFIEQGFLPIEVTQAFLESLETFGIREIEFYNPLGDGLPIYRTYFQIGDSSMENTVERKSGDGPGLVRFVETSFVSQVFAELKERLSARVEPQGIWTFDNGTWPGERASLFEEIDE